ncbi:MAG: NADH-quinone oxidoreductase subunit J [Anaerolineales bacterium]|nr:NADH-quinone oxidoreductase subunit J [Anaerolineales bacterium]
MILQIIFLVVAAATLFTAFMVVISRNLVHSALWLIAALFGVAVIYGLLEAGFLAVVQVVIYIGAIAILIIFAIMLTRKLAQDPGPRFNANWSWGAALAVILFAALIWMFKEWPGIQATSVPLNNPSETLRSLGLALVSPDAYVLPFELASVLLLAALIGSILIAWERKKEVS